MSNELVTAMGAVPDLMTVAIQTLNASVAEYGPIHRIPPADLIRIDNQFSEAMQPAARCEAQVCAGLIIGSYRNTDLQDAKVFVAGLVDELIEYPSWIFPDLVREIRRTCKWFPTIAEIVGISGRIRGSHHWERAAVKSARRDHEEREAEQRKLDESARREAERFAEQARRLEDIFQSVDVPSGVELKDAYFALPCRQWAEFDEALYAGERWALEALSWLAVVGRLIRHRPSTISAVLNLVDLISIDLSAGRELAAAIEDGRHDETGPIPFDHFEVTASGRAVTWDHVHRAVGAAISRLIPVDADGMPLIRADP